MRYEVRSFKNCRCNITYCDSLNEAKLIFKSTNAEYGYVLPVSDFQIVMRYAKEIEK